MATNKTIEEKLKEGRSYRDISLASFERRTEDEGKMMVTGYATTFNDPYLLYDFGDYRVIEQVDPNAFDDCEMDDVIMQYDHQPRLCQEEQRHPEGRPGREGPPHRGRALRDRDRTPALRRDRRRIHDEDVLRLPGL